MSTTEALVTRMALSNHEMKQTSKQLNNSPFTKHLSKQNQQ